MSCSTSENKSRKPLFDLSSLIIFARISSAIFYLVASIKRGADDKLRFVLVLAPMSNPRADGDRSWSSIALWTSYILCPGSISGFNTRNGRSAMCILNWLGRLLLIHVIRSSNMSNHNNHGNLTYTYCEIWLGTCIIIMDALWMDYESGTYIFISTGLFDV